MSNKPKGVKRLTEYFPTKGERSHMAMVCEAKKQGLKQTYAYSSQYRTY